MKEQDFQSVGAQSLEDRVDTFQNVLTAEVEPLWCSGRIFLPADSAFGLDHNAIPEGRSFLQNATKNLLRSTSGINVGVVEEVHADFVGRVKERARLLFVFGGQDDVGGEATSEPHATHGQAGYLQICVGD